MTRQNVIYKACELIATSIRGPYCTITAVFHKGVYTKVFKYDLDRRLACRKFTKTYSKAGEYNE